MKPGEEASIAGYRLAFRGVAPATGAELPRAGRPVRRRRAAGRPSRELAPVQAPLRHAPAADDGSRHPRVLARRPLRRARRRAGRTAAMRCASTSIRSCASSGSARSSWFSAAPCRSRDRRLRVGAPAPRAPALRVPAPAARVRWLQVPAPRWRGWLTCAGRCSCPAARPRTRSSPTRCCRPGARGARARHLRGAALPRLPEPVDRRLQRPARARPAPARARAARRPATATGRCWQFVEARYGEFVLLRPRLQRAYAAVVARAAGRALGRGVDRRARARRPPRRRPRPRRRSRRRGGEAARAAV